MNKRVFEKYLISMAFFIVSSSVLAQDNQTKKFVFGYETLEMAMNKFQYFAGEIGYRFDPVNQIRLMIGEVNLTERHLSSSWEAVAVDGKNVDGYFRIYELYYDRFFGESKSWYYSGSIGYTNDKYNHLISSNKINNKTATIGFCIGYQKLDLFGIEHLYINASMPFRFYFNDIPETKWGDTKILPHKFINNIWIFIGYNF